MTFQDPNRKGRLAQLGYLFMHSFTIVGRDPAIIAPVIRMIVYAAVMTLIFFIGIFLIFYGSGNSTWFLLAGALMFVYKFFYYNRAGLTLSRLVYETATDKKPTRKSVRKSLAGLGKQVWVLGLLDIASAWVQSRKNKEGGFLSFVLGGIVGIWDLVSHFLLPAFAIDRLSLKDGIARLKRLKDHVPESLAGVFGINILGGVVGMLMAPAHFFGIVFGVVLGLLLGDQLPDAFSAGKLGEWFSSMPVGWVIGPRTVFSWLPLLILVFLGFFLHAVLARIIDALKVIYFTLFYARITHADDLAPDIRADLDGYLELEGLQPSHAPA